MSICIVIFINLSGYSQSFDSSMHFLNYVWLGPIRLRIYSFLGVESSVMKNCTYDQIFHTAKEQQVRVVNDILSLKVLHENNMFLCISWKSCENR